MDPISQGLLGAAATGALFQKRLGRRAWLFGALSGMAADLDVFIRSASDPLMALEFHRHFTHSLAFIPIGGLLTALPWVLRRRFRPDAKAIIAATTIGYATHGLLDAFTSYGTQLLWPFSGMRVAWDWVGIVDPLYTLILAIGVIYGLRGRSERPARLALLASSLYLAFGGIQHRRAIASAEALAESRGHMPARIKAFPSPLTNVVWRTVYEADGSIFIDQTRAPWVAKTTVIEGTSVDLVTEELLPETARSDPDAMQAFATYRWFADGWTARVDDDQHAVADLRFAIVPHSARPLWGMRLRPGERPPVELLEYDDEGLDVTSLWRILFYGRP